MVADCLERARPGLAGTIVVSVAALAMAIGLSSCRVGPFHADALTEPFPDAAFDHGRADADADADGGPPCDLIAQICHDPKEFCYPVDNQAGATTCHLPGTGPVTTACASNLDCDKLEACVTVPETGMQMCVTICDTGAIDAGCPPKAPCHLIPGYSAGYCVP